MACKANNYVQQILQAHFNIRSPSHPDLYTKNKFCVYATFNVSDPGAGPIFYDGSCSSQQNYVCTVCKPVSDSNNNGKYALAQQKYQNCTSAVCPNTQCSIQVKTIYAKAI
jgi:hypothetical protein